MYQLDWVAQLRSGRTLTPPTPGSLAVSPTVWKLGYTSFFTDVSSVWLRDFYADRRRLQKEVATVGYALSAVSKAGLLAAGNVWPIVVCVLALDRVGKGIRTDLRDPMISFASRSDGLATAFAVHHGLDAGGAVVGLLVAYLLPRLVPGAFDLVLVASACLALVDYRSTCNRRVQIT